MARFFVDIPLSVNTDINLPIDVVRHINVLRIRLNDNITLFNNSGYDYSAEIVSLDKRNVHVKILAAELVSNESKLDITIYMALIANDKFDLVLQKAVELGVTRFVPIYCQNTQRFKDDKLANKIEHWSKIIISASEQCGRSRLMMLDVPHKFSQAVANDKSEARYIFSPHHAGGILQQKLASVSLVIGPEGGLTLAEVAEANQHGFNSVLLGKRILRAETAAISGIAILQNMYGDF